MKATTPQASSEVRAYLRTIRRSAVFLAFLGVGLSTSVQWHEESCDQWHAHVIEVLSL